MLILGHQEVRAALEGNEKAVLDAVRRAYLAHEHDQTTLPHSVFLRFTGPDRIIALPARLGDERPVAGVKWVSSFPANLTRDLPRASAVIVLNSATTGRPEAFLEGSLISAARTGASAALAAATLAGQHRDTAISLIGCGPINFEVLRYVRITCPDVRTVTLYDTDPQRTAAFAEQCAQQWPELAISAATDAQDALSRCTLVSVATTASTPHLNASHCLPGTLVLHVSLRDLTAESILDCVNIVDDPDHVCRAGTSVHLAEQLAGNRRFLDATLGQLLASPVVKPRDPQRVTVFSPFGLGVLDLSVAQFVVADAEDGLSIPDFLP